MAKRKVIRKSNRPFTYNPHYYAWGGDFKAAMGGIGSAVGNIAGGAIGGGLESGAGSAISNIGGTIGSAVSAVNPVLGGIISAGSGIIGGLTNRMFGSKLNEEKIAEVEGSNKAINTVMVDSSSADSVMDQWDNQDFGADFSKSDIGEDGWFSNKAKNKYKELKKQQDIARNRALTSYENAADAADTQSDLNAMASFAAFGGPLGIWGGYGSGAIGYELAKENLGIKALNAANKGKLTSLPNSFESSELNTFAKGGKIHIKPENRGKFTKYCGGKVTSECIARGKKSSDPAVRKRATFAANARKWHHAFGGDLLTHGAEWDNGLRVIGNGGTHEENPMEGVPMGMDAEGTPNLVEQGEVIFNDYVFSNRMFADGGLLESFNLPKSYDGYSFAAIAEKLGDESKERPNDPISKRGLLSSMSRLQQVQETVRQQNQVGQEGIKYATGGLLPDDYTYTPVFGKWKSGVLPEVVATAKRPNMIKYRDYNIPSNIIPIDIYGLYNGFEGISPVEGIGISNMDYNIPSTLDSTSFYNSNTTNKRTKTKEKGNKDTDFSWLRYAPVVGAAIGLGQNLFSKPDYTSADAILEAADKAGNYTPIEYSPIGNYLTYKPFDRNYYINKLNAQAGATRRAILNTTSPSRNAALLAVDYNAQGRLGDLARQAEEYNLAQRQAVETFNRGTNMANAEMGLKAAMANQEAALKARSSRLSGVAQAMAVRDAVDARRGASISANLTNFFNSLGDIGREEYSRDMITSNPAMYYTIDRKGNISYKKDFYNLPPEEQKAIRFKAINEAGMKLKKESKAKGGYLTIKRGGKNG